METWAREAEAEELTPRRIFEHLDRYVVGQTAAKRALSLAAYQHLQRVQARRLKPTSLLQKSNVLLIGPTGCGKTHLARNLARILSVPFVTVDATEYTEAGYYGKDAELMVAELLNRAEQSVEQAERGIIFIDEVDKIARRSQGARNGAGSRDIGGEGVQQALLKLLEGREVSVPITPSPQWNKHEQVRVDTRDILFICAGTFTDLHDDRDGGGKTVGFGSERLTADARQRSLTLKQLGDFGMLAEFLGRLPVRVQLDRLSRADLLQVLTEPPDAITREMKERLAMEDVEVLFQPDGLEAVVRYADDKGLGARGLRGILEHVMADILYEAPENRHAVVKIDAALVERRLVEADHLVH